MTTVPTVNPYSTQRAHESSEAVHGPTPDGAGDVVAECYAEDAVWNGHAPIDQLDGREALEVEFGRPRLTSFPTETRWGRRSDRRETTVRGRRGRTGSLRTLGLPGMAATDTAVAFRVLDFWRRGRDLRAETWVYVGMVDLLGVDVFGRLRAHPEPVAK